LTRNGVAVLVFPFPNPVDKGCAGKVMAALALGCEGFFDDVLGCDTRVVGAGEPFNGIALHSTLAANDIDEGVFKGVANVERTSNVWRWDDY